MKNLIHFTSQENWERIKSSKRLYPKSESSPNKITKKSVNIWLEPTYTVCLPEESLDNWDCAGILGYLMAHTTGEVELNIDLTKTEGVFVKDYFHLSPERFLDLYGEDLFLQWSLKKIDVRDPRIVSAMKNYEDSAVLLDEYDGTYKCPEIWIPFGIPLDKIQEVTIK